MLPWVAIAAVAGASRLERWAAAVVVLTFVEWTAFDVNHAGRLVTELAVVGRDAALVGLLLAAAAELRAVRHPPAADAVPRRTVNVG